LSGQVFKNVTLASWYSEHFVSQGQTAKRSFSNITKYYCLSINKGLPLRQLYYIDKQ